MQSPERFSACFAASALTGLKGRASASADGIAQYGRLAVETRALVDNLDTLVELIRRDPSRFFLDPRAPEYRR